MNATLRFFTSRCSEPSFVHYCDSVDSNAAFPGKRVLTCATRTTTNHKVYCGPKAPASCQECKRVRGVSNLQQWGVDMRNDVRQSPPLSDCQAAGHLHQALNKVELLLLWVTDGQVPTVHVHLPSHLLRTAQFHLTHTQTHNVNWICIFKMLFISLKYHRPG